jgi:hypothetical protein
MMTTKRRKDRPLEWFLGGLSVVWGTSVYVTHDLEALIRAGLPTGQPEATQIAALCALLGVVHMIALLVNGTASWTPLVRLVVTAVNAGFFAWVSAMALQAPQVGPAALVYGYIAMGFAWCGWVAGQDVARMRLGTYGL